MMSSIVFFLIKVGIVFLTGVTLLMVLSLFSFKKYKENAYIYLKEVKAKYYKEERQSGITFNSEYAKYNDVIIIDDELNEILINIVLELYKFREMLENKMHKKFIKKLLELFPECVTYVIKLDGDRVSFTTYKIFGEIYKILKKMKEECVDCRTPRTKVSDMIKRAEMMMAANLFYNRRTR